MKIGNFGRLDPELKKQGIVGLIHGSKLEEEVWNEFNGNWESLGYESELLISKFSKVPLIESAEMEFEDDKIPLGIDRETILKQRVNQNFFRKAVLSGYNSRCCITGIDNPVLLIASHIKPWSKCTDKTERLNPRNGLCLNALHDKAFDRGLITITTNYKVIVSNHLLKSGSLLEWFNSFNNRTINLPDRFLPSIEFLEFHNKYIFGKINGD